MAKVTDKKPAATDKKTAPAKSKIQTEPVDVLEKAGEDLLKKLQSLNLDLQLQADMQWCLGSYRHDKNPVGLLDMVTRSITLLKEEQAKKTKGITTKLITDLEKILKTEG